MPAVSVVNYRSPPASSAMKRASSSRLDYSSTDRGTRPPALALLRQAGLLARSEAHVHVLDNACGLGTTTAALYDEFASKRELGRLRVICGDVSMRILRVATERVAQMEGLDAEVRVLDAQVRVSPSTNPCFTLMSPKALSLPSNHFTHVLTNFGFQIFSEPILALHESVRVAKPGGIIGLTTWTHPGWVPAFRLAVARIPGSPSSLPDPLPFTTRTGSWSDPVWIRAQLVTLPAVDASTICIERHAFEMPLEGEEDVRRFVRHMEAAGAFEAFMEGWSVEKRRACEGGQLALELVRALMEEHVLVWESAVVTCTKRRCSTCLRM
ncbi:hypothetical protein H0H81_002587 [Sphagnurus paluster]|uniref:Methyltransferase type 11 domain-containing protein n=1 Tax=Sphagnurus paluster TaxID=117069 RepID=A0A9P7FZE9_9AGAR|nr:hypothetical protein H0H81_002587 [Sphagnurus paluster]